MRAVILAVVAVAACKRVAPSRLDIAACNGVAGVDEECELVTNKKACETAPCTKLLVMFSGGEQGCASYNYTKVLDRYAKHGWAGVCINVFETARGAGTVPYLDEAPRYDLTLREAIAWAKPHWTGEDLLYYGISHGASSPLIAIARTDLETAPHWRGTKRTAACLLDGTYDQHASAELLRTGARTRFGERPCGVPVPYRRWLERYCR